MSKPSLGNERLSFREISSYTAGAVGSNVIYALVGVYLLYFYTESVGLKAAAVGTLLLAVRLVDGAADLLMGVVVDNTNTRWGKLRPYLLAGGFCTGAMTAICFLNPGFSPGGKLVFAYGSYLLWSVSYTLCDVPYWSLTAALTDDPHERTRVTAVSRTGAQFGYWVVTVGALPFVKFCAGSWALAGITAGGIGMAGFLIAFLGTRERAVLPRREKQTPRSALRFLRANRPLLYLLLACLLLETVSNIRGAFVPYFFKYFLGRPDLIAYSMAANVTLIISGCLCSPAVARRVGKVNAALYGYVAVGAATALMYFAGKNIPLLLGLTAAAGFFEGISTIARMSCLADCVEYGEWKTGNRADGLVFSANIFKTKVASALAGAIPAYLLAWIGYLPNTTQSAGTLHWIALFFTLILGLASVAAILPLLNYELHEGDYAKIMAAMRHRDASLASSPAVDPSGHGMPPARPLADESIP